MKGFFGGTMALVVAAALGGGVAVAVGELVDGETQGTTTIIRELQGEGTGTLEPAGEELGRTIQDIYRTAGPGVVQVTSTVTSEDPFFGSQSGTALGSGFVIDKAGHIVTNFHVIQNANEVEVNFSNDDRMKATVVGVDPSTDIAVLQVNVPARALKPIPLGDSDRVLVGDRVVAIGNPFGLDRTVTAGIVSAVQRQIQAPDDFVIDKVIQTDAAINRGNSGGPLLSGAGEVIGVNTQIATGGAGEGNVGIGFAVPINTVKEVVAQIIETGTVEHAYLGIRMETVDSQLTESFRLPVDHGALVIEVVPRSPADRAGLKAGDTRVIINGQSHVLGGDIVTALDGVRIDDVERLSQLIRAKKPGDTVSLEIWRDDKRLELKVKLGSRPPRLRS